MNIKHIGIYGDSFGTYSLSGNEETRLKGLSYHWSSLLKQEFNCELTNYALSGSSVYYSYKEFVRTNHLHDLNIFLITEPSRYTKPVTLSDKTVDCVTNQWQIEVWKKTRNNLTDNDLYLLDKLDGWFEMSDLDYHYDISELMVDRVYSTNSNVILLPCYDISLREEHKAKFGLDENTNLCTLYYAQMKEMGLSDEGMNTKWSENSEFISGHLTPEYNQIAYENISAYIKNRIWDWKIPNSKIINSVHKDNYYHRI